MLLFDLTSQQTLHTSEDEISNADAGDFTQSNDLDAAISSIDRMLEKTKDVLENENHEKDLINNIFNEAAEDDENAEIKDIDDGKDESLSDQEIDTPTALTIAEHLRQDPAILSSFRPSALRNVVDNPESLSILPMPVLDRIVSDPIFSVELPMASLKKITLLLQDIANKKDAENNTSDNAEHSDEEYDYDYYDLDLGDAGLTDTAVSFVGDLSAEFLQSIDSDILVEYFENASPADLKTIMTNSSILLNLPSSTIGSLLGKLNQEVLEQILLSPAVRDLYLSTTTNVTKEEMSRIMEWQMDVAEHIITNVSSNVLTKLPEEVVLVQLNNTRALLAAIKHPLKLEALLNHYSSILANLDPERIVEIVNMDADAFSSIPTHIFIKLATCPVVRRLSQEFTAEKLIRNETDKFLTLLISNPHIVECIAEENLGPFITKTIDDAEILDMKLCEYTNKVEQCETPNLRNLTISILKLDDDMFLRIAEREDVMKRLPDSFLIEVINERPNLILKLSLDIILDLATSKPWLVGRFNLITLMKLIQRDDLLMSLGSRDLANLLAFQPAILTVLSSLPTKTLAMYLSVHTDLLDYVQPPYDSLKRILQNKELIRSLPIEAHAELAKKPVLIDMIDGFNLIDILEVHPYVINLLTQEERKPFIKFLYEEYVRNRIPCATVRTAVKDPSILDLLPNDLLAKVLTSRHMMSCIDRKDLEMLVRHSDLGSRVSFSTLLVLARNLRLSQISLRIVTSFIRHQLPNSSARLFYN